MTHDEAVQIANKTNAASDRVPMGDIRLTKSVSFRSKRFDGSYMYKEGTIMEAFRTIPNNRVWGRIAPGEVLPLYDDEYEKVNP